MHIRQQHGRRTLPLAGLLIALAGCGSDYDSDDPVTQPAPEPETYSYRVTVTNLTNAQPLSPIAVVLHQQGQLWTLGESASVALERLAEGGSTDDITDLDMVQASATGSGPIAPGASESLEVSIEEVSDALLSLATMLVNTNDAFTGVTGVDLSELQTGQSWSAMALSYDAGTEANTEGQGTMPGPADSGVGFGEARDDVDFVSLHPGVISADDGLSTSVLDASHKFDNPVMRVTITRID